MLTVRDLLKIKGGQVFSISPDTSTMEALQVLTDRNIGALLVMDGNRLAGIISERDFVHSIAGNRDCLLDRPVSETMTTQVFTVSPDQTIEDCMKIMTERHFRHLPVMNNGSLVGLISIGDVVKAVISEQSSLIDDLKGYIQTGR